MIATLAALSCRSLRSVAVAVAVVAVGVGCTHALRAAPSSEWSGFLEDYSRLRLGEVGDLPYVYRDATVDWTKYDKVLFEPVTLWRSGRETLASIPEEDLLRLVARFETVVRGRLGAGFQVVTDPEPDTLRLRLAITDARASDPIVDVLTASPEEEDVGAGSGSLGTELTAFLDAAVIEGEVRDAVSGDLLAQGIDRRAKGAPPRLDTWEAFDRALAFWADRVCGRLESHTGK